MVHEYVSSVDDPVDRSSGLSTQEYAARELADLHADLGRQIMALSTSDDALAAVTAVALTAVPGADHASITRGRGSRYRTLAPTDEVAAEADRLQYELNSGPCVDSVQTEHPYLVADLARDGRWPEYGPLAAERFGIGSMIAVRMVLEDDVRASLNLYSDTVDGLTPHSETIAMVLSTHAAAGIGRIMARERAHNMERALVNSRLIGTAVGILMYARKLTSDQAFALIRMASQNRNLKVHVVAADVIETGRLDVSQ